MAATATAARRTKNKRNERSTAAAIQTNLHRMQIYPKMIKTPAEMFIPTQPPSPLVYQQHQAMMPTQKTTRLSTANNGAWQLEVPVPVGTVINQRYRIGYSLGQGSFGWVNGCTDLAAMHLGTSTLAVKLYKYSNRQNDFEREVALLIAARNKMRAEKELATSLGLVYTARVPMLHDQDVIRCICAPPYHQLNQSVQSKLDKSGFIIMDRLGPSLSNIVTEQYNSQLPVSLAAHVGSQLLAALAFVHSLGYAHNDVKKNNFALASSAPYHLTIFDFGRATKFYDDKKKYWLPERATETDYGGPLWYASFNGHARRTLGPHDDVAALCYMLVHLTKGTLPWMGIFEPMQVLQMKASTPLDQLFKDLPIGWMKLLDYATRSCTYGQWPDYEYMNALLRHNDNNMSKEQSCDVNHKR